ncbi:MAG: zinc-ribbon domain-containing protein [Gemmobacter sp.]
MRIGCPNCDAQYEVPDSAIPPEGRDVQCSNCGHVWFQRPAGHEPAHEPEPAPEDFGTEDATEEADEWSEILTEEPEAADEHEQEREDETAPAAEPSVPRRPLDDALLAILKEEAERETKEREAEAARARMRAVETQPDLGLSPGPSPMTGQRTQAAADAEDTAQELAAPRSHRREAFPDIEQINSTLRASDEARPGDDSDDFILPETQRQRGRGFRRGFLTVVAIAALVAVLYVLAARISASYPQAAPAMQAYVAAVDSGRRVVDRAVNGAMAFIGSQSD